MKHLLIGTLALDTDGTPVPAQKIESETPSREHVVRVQTAMNHLTVIEVGEPVTTVAVGSPQSFKVERRENKVFIQPLVGKRLHQPFYMDGFDAAQLRTCARDQRCRANGFCDRLPPAATAGAVDPAKAHRARRP